MPGLQRYVSDELTHFVGRGSKESDQYELLVRILKSGELRPKLARVDDASDDASIQWHPGTRASDNETIAAWAVCFCDIPVDDLDLHMSKYSRFGLAFQKSLLIRKGANPVFYVAKDSLTRHPEQAGDPPGDISRGDYWDLYSDQFLFGLMRLDPNDPEAARSRRLFHFLLFQVFGFLKFFAAESGEADPHNFYMEREWRVLGRMTFSLDDVWRVILPAEYSPRLRMDLPNYTGQVTFVKSE
jgi:hypothetical protein